MDIRNEYIFRCVDGRYVNISGDSELLSDVLNALNIIIDDKCQFARFKDFSTNRTIEYRAYTDRIRINIYYFD